MRKWGVNWSNLKKEFSSEENGDLGSKLRSKVESVSNKRSSYAEVRAAVAERRDRERSTQSEEEGNSSRSTSPARGSRGKDAVGGERGSQLSVPSLVQQTSKRSITPVLAPKKSQPSVSLVNTDIDATDDISEDEVRPAPIQAQPQAKTMTIPGIHASHRGEVMSMGYVAPQPSVLSDSLKSKNPAIQSVYRLWRSPGNTGQTGQDSDTKQNGASTTPGPEDQSPQPPLQAPGLARQTPPPLPPRSVPTAPPRLNDVVVQDQPGTLSSADPAEAKGDALSGEAVASLSDEMTLDATIIPSTTSIVNAPPPLPPRRIQSTA